MKEWLIIPLRFLLRALLFVEAETEKHKSSFTVFISRVNWTLDQFSVRKSLWENVALVSLNEKDDRGLCHIVRPTSDSRARSRRLIPLIRHK